MVYIDHNKKKIDQNCLFSMMLQCKIHFIGILLPKVKKVVYFIKSYISLILVYIDHNTKQIGQNCNFSVMLWCKIHFIGVLLPKAKKVVYFIKSYISLIYSIHRSQQKRN